MNIPSVIASELNVKVPQVEAVIKLFSEGATIPFIARYRKEHTGGLDEEVLRQVEDRLNYLTLLEERREAILKSIEEQGKLTDELRQKLNAAVKLQELEDIYLPYKPKRKTRGTVAKAKGLEPLALFILQNPQFKGNFGDKLNEFVNAELGVNNTEEALQGAKDIIAEMISDTAEVRKEVREYLLANSLVKSEKAKGKAEEKTNEKLKERDRKEIYQIYYEFSIDIKKIKPYQVLALNRGEKEKTLKVTLSFEHDEVIRIIKNNYFEYKESVFIEVLDEVTKDSFIRLIYPSIEREIRNQLTENADLHAIEIFAANLRQLLLQPPLAGKMIMGIDPGFYSGSKAAVIDETGRYLEGTTIYPSSPAE